MASFFSKAMVSRPGYRRLKAQASASVVDRDHSMQGSSGMLTLDREMSTNR
jgi:hypothetical protein